MQKEENEILARLIDNIIDQWKSESIRLNGPSSLEVIEQVENLVQFSFPDDFKALYLRVDGFKDWDVRPNMFSIWPLERIVDEYKENQDKNFIGFSDYLINSHHIGFYKHKIGIYICHAEYFAISPNFIESIQAINSDSEAIY